MFSAFYSGKYEQSLEIFAASDIGSTSQEDLHYAVAASAILGRVDSQLVEALPEPLTMAEFASTLQQQIAAETEQPLTGMLVQPRYLHKTLLAAALGLEGGRPYFVETGTYIGHSLYQISGLFKHLWTVEASPDLYRAASALFSSRNITTVTLMQGNSIDLLRDLPADVMRNAVFFLDAHYSHGITSQEYGWCPLLQEIPMILDVAPNALIVVDDLRTMSGINGYPTLEQLFGVLPSTARAQIAFDQLIINPGSDSDWLRGLVQRLQP